jgi:hypothetical protein
MFWYNLKDKAGSVAIVVVAVVAVAIICWMLFGFPMP